MGSRLRQRIEFDGLSLSIEGDRTDQFQRHGCGEAFHDSGMAGAARDFGILAFGLALSLFAVLFCWWMIKIAYDEAERRSAEG